MVSRARTLFRNACRVPNRTALVSAGVRRSCAKLDARVNQTAHALAAAGLRKGDRLALMSPNTEGFVDISCAAMRLGLVVVPVNPRMAAPEVTHLLDDSGARAFVFDSSLRRSPRRAAPRRSKGLPSCWPPTRPTGTTTSQRAPGQRRPTIPASR